MVENNKMNISRRGFLKATALAGAALAVPTGLDKVFASETKQPETSRTDNESARIREHRVLGTGKAAFEVSALGFGVMGMTYNRSQHPDKKQCIRLLHEAVNRGITLFDTAIIYGPLTNEELAGEALSEFKGRINVTTKFGHEVINGKATGVRTAARKPSVVIVKSHSVVSDSIHFPCFTSTALIRILRWKR